MDENKKTSANRDESAVAMNQDNSDNRGQAIKEKAIISNPVNFVNIPAELKKNASFCVWKRELRGGSITKVPYNAETGKPAKSNDASTFSDFTTAMKAYAMGGVNGNSAYAGIGFRVSEGIGAIDIDHCIREDATLNDVAATVLSMFNTSYFERSPSGTGLRGFFKLSPDFTYDKTIYYINNRQHGLEVYLPGTTNRFVTVTGDMYKPGEVVRNDAALKADDASKEKAEEKAGAAENGGGENAQEQAEKPADEAQEQAEKPADEAQQQAEKPADEAQEKAGSTESTLEKTAGQAENSTEEKAGGAEEKSAE